MKLKPCLDCEGLTESTCVCGHGYCPDCQLLYKSKLCPLCVRIKRFKDEQAMLNCVVPWQSVDSTTSMLLSVGKSIEPGAVTIPVPVEIKL
jgi:hypothetical protein